MENHHGSDCKEYHMQEEAYDAYRQAHYRLIDMKSATSNENLQGILSKTQGLCSSTGDDPSCIRIATILQQ